VAIGITISAWRLDHPRCERLTERAPRRKADWQSQIEKGGRKRRWSGLRGKNLPAAGQTANRELARIGQRVVQWIDPAKAIHRLGIRSEKVSGTSTEGRTELRTILDFIRPAIR
jgi:hypothetical protein